MDAVVPSRTFPSVECARAASGGVPGAPAVVEGV